LRATSSSPHATARFGLPEVKRGIAAAAGGLLRLPRLIPPKVAMEMALSGSLVDARFLHRHGLVNRLVEHGRAHAEATALARTIMANAPLAVAASKRVIVEQRNWTDEESFVRQELITGHLLLSDDAHEGATAFKERRTPHWRGR
jgi:enoyl-CoA hydratase